MKCKYMRIQGREKARITQYPKGIFAMCWRLIYDGKMNQEDEMNFRTIEKWFRDNLPEPEVCTNREKVITWFKVSSATEKMREMIEPAMEILDHYDHPYDVIFTNYVGEIVYEDEWQVAVKVPY